MAFVSCPPLPAPTRYCKTKYGYGAFVDVTKPASGMEDKQESYFLAETLKCAVLTVLCFITLMEMPSAILSDGPLHVFPLACVFAVLHRYLYLLFSPHHPIALDNLKYVFNTEAHPLRIFDV